MGKTAYDEVHQLPLFEGGRTINMHKIYQRREALRASSSSQARLTVRGYANDFSIFQRWCADAGRTSLPCSSDTLACYVTWMLDTGERKVATATRHMAAILDFHRKSSAQAPSTAEARKILADFQRLRCERPQGKVALDTEHLVPVLRGCDSTYLGVRNRAIIALGFATSLRRSDLARLNLSDVTFEDRGLAIFVRRSKNDQQGKGRVIGVWEGKRPSSDPVRILRAWIERRGTEPGPLFLREQTRKNTEPRGLAGESICYIVKRAVERTGLDPAAYGAHSLRAGAITACADLGRSDQEIMNMSGHKSAAVMRQYVRNSRLFSGRNPLAGVL